MRSKYRVATGLLIFALMFGFSSCISIERFVKLNADGSGEEELNMIISKEFFQSIASFAAAFDTTASQEQLLDSMYMETGDVTKLREEFSSIEGLTVVDVSSKVMPDSSNFIQVKYLFDDVALIGKSLNKMNEDMEQSSSGVSFKSDGENMVFTYIYEDQSTSMEGSEDSANAKLVSGLSSLFSEGSFKMELDAPFEVISSNATRQEGRKLIWEYAMSDLMKENKLTLEAVMKPE